MDMDTSSSSSSSTFQVVADKGWEPDSKNQRKRKANFDHEETSGTRRFASEEALISPSLYNAIRSNGDNFVGLLMEFWCDADLRRAATVCKEWRGLAFQTLRRRIGCKAFPLLTHVPHEIALNWFQHFHQSYLQCEPRVVPATWKQAQLRFKNMKAQQNCELGYMKKINSKKLAPIQAIISFASQMEQDFSEIDDDNGIPPVDSFVFVVATAIFFTTPDLQYIGDSKIGVYKPESYSSIANGNENIGGKFLASICFPQSSHFRMYSRTIKQLTETSNMSYISAYVEDSLFTQVIILFKLFDCDKMEELLQTDLQTSFRFGANSISVVQGEFLLVGAKASSTPVPGLSVLFLGDDKTSSITVDIIDSDLTVMHMLDNKFHQMRTFIHGYCGHFINYKKDYSFFALLLSYNQSETSTDTTNVRLILERFRLNFPQVPIQGISSDKPIKSDLHISPYCDPDTRLSLELSKMQCSSGLGRDRITLMVLVVFKYPHGNGLADWSSDLNSLSDLD